MQETILERLAKRAPRRRVDEDACGNADINRLLARIKRNISRQRSVSSTRGGLISMGARGPVVKEAGLYNRRVIVKASYVLPNTHHARTVIRHHLHYAAHNKNDDLNKSPELYSHDENGALDIQTKVNDFQKSPHFFNIIISPENGDELNLKEFTRDFVAKVENDLGTKLDWAAGNHYDTNDPHVHLLIKGEDDQGKKLILTRDYISRGLRARASQVATNKLGLRTRDEVVKCLELDIAKSKKTELDKIILHNADENYFDISKYSSDDHQDLPKSLFIQRLEYLESKGLVHKENAESWQLDAQLFKKLDELNRTSSIIERLSGGIRADKQECEVISAKSLADHLIKGHVVERGFANDHNDKEYLVIKSKEKKFIYVELEKHSEKTPAKVGEFIQIEGTKPFSGPKTSDATILQESKNHGGIYDAARHGERANAQGLLPPSVTAKEYAQVHVKRLEILARKGLVEKLDDLRFFIPHDYIDRLTHEAKKSEQRFIAHIKVTRLSPSRLSAPTLRKGLSR